MHTKPNCCGMFMPHMLSETYVILGADSTGVRSQFLEHFQDHSLLVVQAPNMKGGIAIQLVEICGRWGGKGWQI